MRPNRRWYWYVISTLLISILVSDGLSHFIRVVVIGAVVFTATEIAVLRGWFPGGEAPESGDNGTEG